MSERLHPIKCLSECEAPDWTLHTALKLFLLSFRHAQGNTELQERLLDYAQLRQPFWAIAPDWEEGFQPAAVAAVSGFLQVSPDHTGLAYSVVQDEVARQWNAMQILFSIEWRLDLTSTSHVPQHLAGLMIQRDYHYLVKQVEGRPRNPDSSRYRTDPFFSYMCYFGLEGHPTGMAVFDQLYQEVREIIYQSADPPDDLPFTDILSANQMQHLREVIAVYTAHHPDCQLTLKP